MVKIMLVEDDKSLREIYGVRLLAEGYDIVSAGDGEEALAVAIKERPGLIISDVMMPKISGFDMLDILRSTTETRNVKVIMMTALSSDEQRARGEQLGADRYLVKSQVGIEDVVRVVHEVLGDGNSPSSAPAPVVMPQQQPAPTVTTQPPALPAVPTPTYEPPTAPQPPAQTLPPPVPAVASAPSVASQPPDRSAFTTPPPARQNSTGSPESPSARNRTIEPLNNPFAGKVNIHELFDKELAREAGVDEDNRPEVATTDEERDLVNGQINNFANNPAPQPSADDAQQGGQQYGNEEPMANGQAFTPPVPPQDDDQTSAASGSAVPPPPRPPVAL